MKYSRLFKIVLACILVILVWELIIHQFIVHREFEYTAENGFTLKRNSEYRWGFEGYGYERINNIGYPGQDVLPKSAREYRILTLGDSLTEAMQVYPHQKFTVQLEQRLSRPSNNVKVYNLGRAGTSIADYMYNADFINSLEPDKIVIVISGANDVREVFDTSRKIHVKEYELKRLDDARIQTPMIRTFAQTFGIDPLDLKLFAMRMISSTDFTTLLHMKMLKYTDGGTKPIANAPHSLNERTKADIDWLVGELKNTFGDRLIIADIPRVPTVHNGEVMLNDTTQSEVSRTLKASTIAHSVEYVSAERAFIELYTQHRKFPQGFHNTLIGRGHLNKDGHSAVADVLATHILGDAS